MNILQMLGNIMLTLGNQAAALESLSNQLTAEREARLTAEAKLAAAPETETPPPAPTVN